MDRTVKLSDTQARVIRGATFHRVNGGPVTRRVKHIKRTPQATYLKLYRLGLIVAPHEYADLTELGLNAWTHLTGPSYDNRVRVSETPGGKAAVIAEAADYLIEITRADGTVLPVQLPADTTDAEAQVKLAQPGETVALAENGRTVNRMDMARPVVYASREQSDALMSRIRKLAEAQQSAAVPAPERYTVVALGHGFAVVDRTDGTVVADGYNSRYPARQDAARRNADAHPVNWSDIADEPAEWALAGRLGREDVTFAEGSRFVADVYTLWPTGTLVRAEVDGVVREGRVNGADVSYVTRVGHPNFGRAFVGVDLDATGVKDSLRTRIFTDELHRI